MEKTEKISVSDLSIGDWVNIYHRGVKTSYRIKRIFPSEYDGVYMIRTHTNWDVNINGLMPIPITAEVLEKNGLEYIDDGNDAVIFLCCDMFWARLCVGDTFWQVGIHSEDRLDAVVCNVKHTHQLQHALRLAGVGREIVL